MKRNGTKKNVLLQSWTKTQRGECARAKLRITRECISTRRRDMSMCWV